MKKIKFIPGSIKRVYETKGNSLSIDISPLTNLKVDNNRVFIRDTSSANVSYTRNKGYNAYLSDKISTAKRNLWNIPRSVVSYLGWKPTQEAVVVLTEDKELWTKPVKPIWDDMDNKIVSKNLKESKIPPSPVKIRRSKKDSISS